MSDSTRDGRLKSLDPQDVKEATTASVADELEDTNLEDVIVEGGRGAGDVSPHLGRRAQPGDVLGLETGGETTGIGDTSEDENKRRRDLEKQAATNKD